MPLAGRPMIEHVLHRADTIYAVDEVVAAVPDLGEDDGLAEVVRATGRRVVRGSPEDVLARYATAAAASGAGIIVRITADCPLLSPEVSGRVVRAFADCDYASNTIVRTFPRGLDTEAFSRQVLDSAHAEARDPVEREHVTPFLYRHPDRFVLRQVTDALDRSALRWTVDTPEDMAFARAIYEALGVAFEMPDVLSLLAERPELSALNRHSLQKPID
jgi:spore coat polysaccharide biosynthesis protein SpsF